MKIRRLWHRGEWVAVLVIPWRKLHYRTRFFIAIALSLLMHALVIGLTPRQPHFMAPGPMAHAPLNVIITPEPSEPQPPPVESVPVPPAPTPTPAPRPAPRPAPKAIPAPTPPPVAVAPREAPAPLPLPPPIPAPPVDMLAAVEARRAQRRALESEQARAPPSDKPPSDAATRNLATLSGQEGVGGVFQVLRIGTRTGEFAFNGWRPSGRNQWREVIEVDAGLHGNVQVAMIKRMIQLIRTHYSGDFYWESHRLGRVVMLSAKEEDNEGLEDFMMKEFFGQPTLNPRASNFPRK